MERKEELKILIYSIQNKILARSKDLLAYSEYSNIFEACSKVKELTIALENYINEYNKLK